MFYFVKIVLLVMTIALSIHSNAFSQEFRYNKVIACGPKKVEIFDDIPRINTYQYFYIHSSPSGDFVISNNDYQYKSFAETEYSTTWIQNANKTSASLEVSSGILKYKLTNKYETETRVQLLMVDPTTMTYISRVVGYQPSMGVCWNIDTKGF